MRKLTDFWHSKKRLYQRMKGNKIFTPLAIFFMAVFILWSILTAVTLGNPGGDIWRLNMWLWNHWWFSAPLIVMLASWISSFLMSFEKEMDQE